MDDFSNMVFAVFDAVIYLNRACRGIDYGYYQGDKRQIRGVKMLEDLTILYQECTCTIYSTWFLMFMALLFSAIGIVVSWAIRGK
jgi:hypothetical protein